MTLCKKKAGVADVPEADRDAVEAMEDFWSMSGEFNDAYHVVPREQLYVPKESHHFRIPSKYLDVVSKQKTNLDKAEENSIDDSWNIDGNRILSESWSGSTRFRILRKHAPQGYSWVDGRLTKTQVTSRPETIWPEVWPSMSKMLIKRKQSSNECIEKTQNTSCTSEGEMLRYSSRRRRGIR